MKIGVFLRIDSRESICESPDHLRPRGASHEKFHAAPSKKQARFLEGPHPLRIKRRSDLLRSALGFEGFQRFFLECPGNQPIKRRGIKRFFKFFALTELRGENSLSSSQPTISVPKRPHRVFAELTEFTAEPSEFPLPKQYSRKSIPLPLPKKT